MDIALTLVVNPEYDTSLEFAEKTARDCLKGHALTSKTLAENNALDLLFEAADTADLNRQCNSLHTLKGLDWALQPAQDRKKKLILADMDSTIITVECIDELADFMGLKQEVSQITEAAMRGELDFEGALTERVALLKGLTEAQLKSCYDDRIELMSGARALVQTMKAHGAYAALVSGGFTYFTARIADSVGFDMHRANRLVISDGILTGEVIAPICGAQTKLDTLNELSRAHGLQESNILAVGDGANDIPMLQAASLGVAYRAHPKTRAAAGAAIKYGDLTTLLYFQGYRSDEITA